MYIGFNHVSWKLMLDLAEGLRTCQTTWFARAALLHVPYVVWNCHKSACGWFYMCFNNVSWKLSVGLSESLQRYQIYRVAEFRVCRILLMCFNDFCVLELSWWSNMLMLCWFWYRFVKPCAKAAGRSLKVFDHEIAWFASMRVGFMLLWCCHDVTDLEGSYNRIVFTWYWFSKCVVKT